MFPLRDITKMSDLELHTALHKCNAMKNHAMQHGQYQMVSQAQAMIDEIYAESKERELRQIQQKEKKERKNKSDVINFGDIDDNDSVQDPKY